MEDSIRKDLKLLCYDILENYKTGSLTEQLTQVQMLYERLLVLNYLEENGLPPQPEATTKPSRSEEASKTAAVSAQPTPAAPSTAPPQEDSDPPSPAAQDAPSAPDAAEDKPAETPAPESPAEEGPEDLSATEQASAPAESASPGEKPPEKTEPAPETPTFGRRPEAPKMQNEALGGMETPRNLNDHLAKGSIEVGLNDRIAFVKHLFGGAQADFNRVLSQLNSFDRLEEAENFLLHVVKPEYNWEEEEEYEERLLELIRKRFGEPDA